jgi:hypothetical protein
MRNLLALIGAVVVTAGGLGWYLDWFKVRSNPAPAGYKSLNIDINTVKISEDLHRGSVKVQEVLEKNKEEAEAKAAADSKTTGTAGGKAPPTAAPQSPAKKQFDEEGEEAEEPSLDFSKPQ